MKKFLVRLFTLFLFLILPVHANALTTGTYNYYSLDKTRTDEVSLTVNQDETYKAIYRENNSQAERTVKNWDTLKDKTGVFDYIVITDKGWYQDAQLWGYFTQEEAFAKQKEAIDKKITDVVILSRNTSSSNSDCRYDEKGNLVTSEGKDFVVFRKNDSTSVTLIKQDGGAYLESGAFVQLKYYGNDSDFFKDGTFTCPQAIYVYQGPRDPLNGTVVYNVGTYAIDTMGEAESDAAKEENGEKDKESGHVDLSGLNGTIGCEGIFGKIDANGDFEKESFGWILQTILNYIKIIGPILVILFSMMEFIKAIATSDEDAMKKAQSRLVIRLIAVVTLFLLPFLVGEVLKLINGISNPTCGFK